MAKNNYELSPEHNTKCESTHNNSFFIALQLLLSLTLFKFKSNRDNPIIHTFISLALPMMQNLDVTNHNSNIGKKNIFKNSNPCYQKDIPGGNQSLQTVGIFNKYPVGVFNPAFTGMYLWELSSSHELNDYQICQYHSIKSGVILYGVEAYVFTQIMNNNITSHLKILTRGKQFRNAMTLAQAMKLLVNYVRHIPIRG